MPPSDEVQGMDQGGVQGEAQFSIQKLYVKDLSFESPHAPLVFRSEWRPDVDLQLHSDASRLAPEMFEVVLTVTVTVRVGEQSAFLVEAHQAGIFHIAGVPEQVLAHMLGSICPGILFPYARELVSDVVTRGGFPQFLLAPVNFDVLYQRHLEERGQNGQAPPEDESGGS